VAGTAVAKAAKNPIILRISTNSFSMPVHPLKPPKCTGDAEPCATNPSIRRFFRFSWPHRNSMLEAAQSFA
jgi:hypothetical protein